MAEAMDISKVLQGLMAEFDTLLQERDTVRQQEEESRKRREELDRKIAGLQQSIQGLSLYATAQETPTEVTFNLSKALEEISKNFTGLSKDLPKTLSDCCREVLSRNPGWMSAVQVRQSLQAAGFDFSKYTSNPLSSIHTTLKRLVPEEVEITRDDKGDTSLYRWKRKSEATKPAKKRDT